MGAGLAGCHRHEPRRSEGADSLIGKITPRHPRTSKRGDKLSKHPGSATLPTRVGSVCTHASLGLVVCGRILSCQERSAHLPRGPYLQGCTFGSNIPPTC